GNGTDSVPSSGTTNSFIGYSNTLAETGLTAPDANGNFIGGPVGGAIDPLLEALKYNGGPTRTMRPLANSPVIDMGDAQFDPLDPDGDPATDDAILYDQRGAPFDRVVGGRIDIGAVEYNSALTPGDYNGDLMVNGADFTIWRNTLGDAVTPLTTADGSGNGLIDELDYQVWRDHYGETYPPSAASLAAGEGSSPPGWLTLENGPVAVAHSSWAIEPQSNLTTDAIDAALLLLARSSAPARGHALDADTPLIHDDDSNGEAPTSIADSLVANVWAALV
ncbi:MAG: choice-of-anchor Q domain-containing protein, partial [Aeoliella sp.]